MQSSVMQKLRWPLCLLVGTLAYIISSGQAQEVAFFWGVTSLVIAAMALEVLPFSLIGVLLPTLYIVLGITTPKIAFLPWIGVIPWLFIAGMLIGNLMENTGLSRRIVFWLVSSVGTSPIRLFLALMIGGYILGMLIPDAFTTVIITVTLAKTLCDRLGFEKKSREANILLFMGYFAGSTCQTMYYTNTLGIVAGEMLAPKGVVFTWLGFAGDNCIPTFLMSAVSMAILALFFTPSLREKITENIGTLRKDLKDMGRISAPEVRTLIIGICAVAAYITEVWHGIPGVFAFLFVVCLGFTPILPVFGEKDMTKLNYGIIIFCTGCMSIGVVAGELGIASWIAQSIVPMLDGVENPTLLALTSYLLGFVLNFILTPLAASTSMSLPLWEIATSLEIALKPVIYSFLYGLEQVILPYEYAIILYMYSTGYVSLRFFIMIMALRFIGAAMVIAFASSIVWPMVGM
ncbi:MAG: SLC13 family permease [Pseudomonadota bacterium]